MMTSEELIIAIDIGSHHLKILVAEINNEKINILSHLKKPIKKKPADTISTQLQQAINILTEELGYSLQKAFYLFGVSNSLINWKIDFLNLSIDDGIVKQLHMTRAKKEFLDKNDELNLTNVYKNCIVDNNRCISNPIGVKTHSLKLESLIASWKDKKTIDEYEKLIKTISTNRILVYPSILTLPYTYSKDNDHTLFIDIGAQETSFLFFRSNLVGALGHYSFGINSLINDLAIGLNLPISFCRNLIEKKLNSTYKDNSFYSCNIKEQQRYIPHISIHQIIEARLEEIYQLIKNNITQNDKNFDYNKIILVGGGSILHSAIKTANKVFQKPVIHADFLHEHSIKDKLSYNVSFGLLCYFLLYQKEKPLRDNNKTILGRIRQFFNEG